VLRIWLLTLLPSASPGSSPKALYRVRSSKAPLGSPVHILKIHPRPSEASRSPARPGLPLRTIASRHRPTVLILRCCQTAPHKHAAAPPPAGTSRTRASDRRGEICPRPVIIKHNSPKNVLYPCTSSMRGRNKSPDFDLDRLVFMALLLSPEKQEPAITCYNFSAHSRSCPVMQGFILKNT